MITNSYKQAAKMGEKHYTGGPCKHGNVAPRRVSDRKCTCAECSRAKVKQKRVKRVSRRESDKTKLAAALGREIISREAARAAGLSRYFTGVACHNGEIAERATVNHHCQCAKCLADDAARGSAYSATPDGRAKARQRGRNWYIGNIDRARGVVRAQAAKRRARKLNATPAWDAELTDFVMQEAADLCRRREAATGFTWDVDHMVPLQARLACGLHTWANLQVIPARMNRAKHNRLTLTRPGEWIKVA